ncbi:PiggyBac transposable element-derived protein 4 [Merluccius polli]|uniref:PiggyBac transposable element-derived protein 4 n=1 Tax=Merluccius polli TaxID=89951 RepID=A0AA47MJ83_MERPO|nr:PiggyBac transposable element-derived protein 4 [Merluccius polli]
MADSSEAYASEGSDIDEVIDSDFNKIIEDDTRPDVNDIPDDVDVPAYRVVSEQWILAMFQEGAEDMRDFVGFQEEWKTNNFHSREKILYNREPGAKIELPDVVRSIQVFSHIFTEELWMRLVTETNLYAAQTRSATPSKSKWVPIIVTEMKTFVGLCLAMGILRLPSRRDFCRQKKWLYRTTIPQAISRDRFDIIWRYLHLQDNNSNDVNRSDKLWKVRWYLDYLKDRFQELYEVDGFVSVDESMVKFKGRLAFRQYLPLKPTKWGIKVWVMAENSTGYVSNFQVYTGREGGSSEKGLAHRVVMDHNLDLKAHGLYTCGTVRSNRKGIPPKPPAMDKRRYQVSQKDDLTFCAWQDTKVVLVLLNYHEPMAEGSVRRRHPHRGHSASVHL